MKTFVLPALLALATAVPSAFCQDGETQISGVQVLSIGGAGELSGEARQKLAEGAVTMFSPMGGGMTFGSGMGVDPNSGSQLFSLLSNESVRRELKLTEDQFKGSQTIMQESSKKMQQYVRTMMADRAQGGGPIRIDASAMKEMQEESREQAEAAIEEILLPEQLKRIRQLAYQIEVRQSGLGECLVNGRLGTDIDVHEDQKQHLKDRAAAIDAEARAAVARIRNAAQAQLLAELTPDQRKDAEKLLGQYFEYEELSMSQQIRKQVKAMQESTQKPTDAKK